MSRKIIRNHAWDSLTFFPSFPSREIGFRASKDPNEIVKCLIHASSRKDYDNQIQFLKA